MELTHATVDRGGQKQYADFVATIHADRDVPTPLLRAALSAAGIDKTTALAERVAVGESNVVFKVTSSGEHFYVRASDKHPSRLEHEALVIKGLAKAGVLVPEIVALGQWGDFRYMVQRELPGEAFDSLLPELPERNRNELLGQVGAELAKIHQLIIPTSEFVPRHSKYVEMLNGAVDRCQRAEVDHRLTTLCLQTRDDFQRNAAVFDDVPKRLIHFDFGPTHAIGTRQGLSGLIDFELARNGDVVEDFARYGQPPHVAAMLAGYDADLPVDSGLRYLMLRDLSTARNIGHLVSNGLELAALRLLSAYEYNCPSAKDVAAQLG